ncbi:hypothetical protein ACIQVR_27190 [Streptomyces xanthochromogenes]|uniref:hypothetical protein n=1 Tax=Streptomyces xanthochromogenes TaxID=67384 RepID=UPI0038074EC0
MEVDEDSKGPQPSLQPRSPVRRVRNELIETVSRDSQFAGGDVICVTDHGRLDVAPTASCSISSKAGRAMNAHDELIDFVVDLAFKAGLLNARMDEREATPIHLWIDGLTPSRPMSVPRLVPTSAVPSYPPFQPGSGPTWS